MSSVKQTLGELPIVRPILRHWGKILAVPFIAVLWSILIFPYDELRILASTQISHLMPGTSFDFKNFSLGFGFPPSIVLEEVEFERPGIPNMKVDRLSAAPTLQALFSKLPSGRLEASGLYEGSVRASLKTTSADASDGKSPTMRHEVNGSINDVQLGALTSSLKRSGLFHLRLKGKISSDFSVSIDPSLDTAPYGVVSMNGSAIEVPALSLPIPGMGPVQLPTLQFSKLDFKGRLQEGSFNIESLTLGQTVDALSARARGQMKVAIQKIGGRAMANITNLDISIELNVSERLTGAFLGQAIDLLISKYKQKSSTSSANKSYRFRLQISQFGTIPKFSETAPFE
jgi:type II secretion system protein N